MPSGAVQPPAQVDESQVGFHSDAGEGTVQVGVRQKLRDVLETILNLKTCLSLGT